MSDSSKIREAPASALPSAGRGVVTRSSPSLRGRAAKAAGDAFEAFCEGQHRGAQVLGVLVHWAHNEPKSKVVGGRLIFAKKSGTDFSGVLAEGARALAAEAKSTKGKTLPRKRIEKLQAEQLDAVSKVGGVAYLLVEFRLPHGFCRFAIPWLEVPWWTKRTAESLSLEDIPTKYKILPGECYLARGKAMPVVSGRRRVFARD